MAGSDLDKPENALLFPFFCFVLGILSMYTASRFVGKEYSLPYTAELFVIGTILGLTFEAGKGTFWMSSLSSWLAIDGHLLLAGFLPGLLFGDALHINFYLFQRASGQIMLMAFPMVLLGSVLTACVAFYIFPYNWSFSFCMMFGSILAATDPVAVTALLNEVGAPPSLKVLIAGESQFNDGAAIVFFTIFSQIALSEYDPSLGKTYTVGEGFAIFFQMALGGAGIGIAFGAMLVSLLYFLNRRLSREETVMQVTATVAAAYLSFYTAETVAHTSGVIAVVCCGIYTKAFGNNFINEHSVMDHVWLLIEHLLNTVLFVLAGLLWGEILGKSGGKYFTGKDWGFLIMLYIFIFLIRGFGFALFFPILSRIGFKLTWRETTFMTYGGLRGGVGIALAIAFQQAVKYQAVNAPAASEHEKDSSIMYVMIGGISLFTLVINGGTSEGVLKRLGLIDSTGARLEVLRQIDQTIKSALLDDFVHMLTKPRLASQVDWSIIKQHVPTLGELSLDQLNKAVECNKASVAPQFYVKPDVSRIVTALGGEVEKGGDDALAAADQGTTDTVAPTDPISTITTTSTDANDGSSDAVDTTTTSSSSQDAGKEDETQKTAEEQVQVSVESQQGSRNPVLGPLGQKLEQVAVSHRRIVSTAAVGNTTAVDESALPDAGRLNELREIFLEMMRKSYAKMIKKGSISGRSIVSNILQESVEIEATRVKSKHIALDDWKVAQQLTSNSAAWEANSEALIDALCCNPRRWCTNLGQISKNAEFKMNRTHVLVAIAFVAAHQSAQSKLLADFTLEDGVVTPEERQIIEESNTQIALARKVLDETDPETLRIVVNHSIATLLSYKHARFVEGLVKLGALKSREGQVYIGAVEKQIHFTNNCYPRYHNDAST